MLIYQKDIMKDDLGISKVMKVLHITKFEWQRLNIIFPALMNMAIFHKTGPRDRTDNNHAFYFGGFMM